MTSRKLQIVQILHRLALLIISGSVFMATPGHAASDGAGAPPGFASAQVRIGGATLHYVRGGRGPAVILLHGWPEDWAEFRAVMPRLARRFTVVAVDLPGIGHSGVPSGGFGTENLATKIHGLAQYLKLDRPYLVGHDLGGLVSYPYVRKFPESLRGAMILDVPAPGIVKSEAPSGFWHIGFIQAPKQLAEKLVVGRQAPFLGWFFDLGTFTKAKRDYYIHSYGAPQLHSAFEMYRALGEDAKWNESRTSPNTVPLLIVAGEKSFFKPLLGKFVEGFRAKGMTSVESASIQGAGHYLLDDNPDAVASLIERYAANNIKS